MDDGTIDRPRANLKPPGLTAPRRPTVAVRFGRGRTGGSTMLDLLVQLARHCSRDVIVGDGDRRNPTLASLYPPACAGGARQPVSDEVADVKDWISGLLGDVVRQGQSAVIDLGGGDRVMQEYGRDLGLVEFCEEEGINPLGLYFCGADPDDFEHVLAIWRAGYFRPRASVLVLNEHLVPQGRTTIGAFDAIVERPEIGELEAGGVAAMFLPRLPCLTHIRERSLSLIAAATRVPAPDGRPLDPAREFMVRHWIVKVLGEFDRIGLLGILP